MNNFDKTNEQALQDFGFKLIYSYKYLFWEGSLSQDYFSPVLRLLVQFETLESEGLSGDTVKPVVTTAAS